MRALSDRQAHLSEIGVPQWYARTRLPGAAATPDWVLLSPAELLVAAGDDLALPRDASVQAVDALQDSSIQTRSALDSLKQPSFQELRDEPSPTESAKSEPSTNKHSSALELEFRIPALSTSRALDKFSLVLYRTNHGLVFSESIEDGSHPSELQLLKNVLKSLPQLRDVHAACQYLQTFSWPVFRSLNLQSKQSGELAALLSNWLTPQYSEAVKNVLYFGDAFPELQRFFSDYFASISASIHFSAFNHSLAQMIRFPQRKSELWADLCGNLGE